MGMIRVWTRQHKNVWKKLLETGRYTAKRAYIQMDMEEHADIMLKAYDWLVKNGPDAENRPSDVEYPVWVSFVEDATMLPGENGVILELLLDEALITKVNIMKWSSILNYAYLPKDAEDAKRHQELLNLYGTNDAKAVMTSFYPEIKREILDSWKRLFDDRLDVGSDLCYGTIWELKREWVQDVQGQEAAEA